MFSSSGGPGGSCPYICVHLIRNGRLLLVSLHRSRRPSGRRRSLCFYIYIYIYMYICRYLFFSGGGGRCPYIYVHKIRSSSVLSEDLDLSSDSQSSEVSLFLFIFTFTFMIACYLHKAPRPPIPSLNNVYRSARPRRPNPRRPRSIHTFI
jgi:hypothetical protein